MENPQQVHIISVRCHGIYILKVLFHQRLFIHILRSGRIHKKTGISPQPSGWWNIFTRLGLVSGISLYPVNLKAPDLKSMPHTLLLNYYLINKSKQRWDAHFASFCLVFRITERDKCCVFLFHYWRKWSVEVFCFQEFSRLNSSAAQIKYPLISSPDRDYCRRSSPDRDYCRRSNNYEGKC